MRDIERWLARHGLEKYVGAFVDNEVEPGDLGELSDADLRELGLALGPRRRRVRGAQGILDTRRLAVSSWKNHRAYRDGF